VPAEGWVIVPRQELPLDTLVLQVDRCDCIDEKQRITMREDSLDRRATVLNRLHRCASHVERAFAEIFDEGKNVRRTQARAS
jgi:hypothetical protein